MEIQVKKRNGSFELFSADKVNKVVDWACEGVSGVHQDDVCTAFKTNLRNKISSQEIHRGLIEATAGLITESSPNYEIVAANLLNYELRKEVWGGKDSPDFLSIVKQGVKDKRYTPEILEFFSEDEIISYGKLIDHNRDFRFKYSGLSQVIDKYLSKNLTTKSTFETPNIAYMLIAMCLFHKEKEYIKEAYDCFSLHKISLPTPIFAGVRTTLKSFSSCCLMDIGDSTNEICATFEAIAKATAKRYGIGVNMTKMRPVGSPIRGGESLHTGKMAFTRTIQDTIKTWMQSSTRSGAATLTFPIWDYEIEEIIQLKDIMRPESLRIGDVDYSISFSKLFYDRWKNNENITLFSAHEVPELEKFYGLPEFDELYIRAEKNPKIKMKKTVSARTLFSDFNKQRVETGRYYILNIDHANTHSSFKDTVQMSNLCQEVIFPVKPFQNLQDENGLIGICILAAIVPTNIKTDEELERTCFITVRMLDNLIDYQNYFSAPAEIFATKFRALGIGITNFAGWLARKGIKYSSQEALDTANVFFEKFQYYLLKASNQLAIERGPCEYFNRTKYSDGILPIDTYEKNMDTVISKELKQDWDSLRQSIVKNGLRHSTLSCFMPVEATSLCTNSTNGVERPRSNFVIKTNKSKDFPVVTPNFNKWKYEYAFENENNEDHLKMMGVIQKYTDMSISTNLYYNYSLYPGGTIPAKVINRDMSYAHYLGIKTIYYTNSDDGNKHNLSSESDCESGACAI